MDSIFRPSRREYRGYPFLIRSVRLPKKFTCDRRAKDRKVRRDKFSVVGFDRSSLKRSAEMTSAFFHGLGFPTLGGDAGTETQRTNAAIGRMGEQRKFPWPP